MIVDYVQYLYTFEKTSALLKTGVDIVTSYASENVDGADRECWMCRNVLVKTAYPADLDSGSGGVLT